MKKLLGVVLAGIFLLSIANMSALAYPKTQPSQPAASTFTHTIFAEDGTATWCGYCHYAREALDAVYTSGDYPFYYVCLVDDKNTHVAPRLDEYNVYGFPTVWFDGGYNTQLGGYTGNEDDYRIVIQDCGNQTVSDIDIALDAAWEGDATIGISVSVQNNEDAAYTGHVHVYVCEVESSMGWVDTAGHPYTMAFLDYAQHEDLNIASGDTWSNSMTWVGADHNDGYGHDYSGIQSGNVEVIAVVFNSEVHQGYSYPPSGYPFNAHYVDDAAGARVGDYNIKPNQPSDPNPSDGATNVPINQDLSWTCTDPNNDTLSYDVYFGTTNPPALCSPDQTENIFDTGTMTYNTTYYWKIVATDPYGLTNESPVWSFTTGANPDNQPPTISMVKPLPGRLYLFNIGLKRLLSSKTLVIGTLTISADVADNMSGVQRVEVFIDGGRQFTFHSPPYDYQWSQSFGFAPTSHTIKLIAYDMAGNSAESTITLSKML